MAFAIIIIGSGLAMALIVGLVSHRRKIAKGSSHLIGAKGLVSSMLSPEGAILINGEIWRARSVDGRSIPATANVRVVDVEEHLLLVDRHL